MDHSTIGRWVLRYAPELHRRIRRDTREPQLLVEGRRKVYSRRWALGVVRKNNSALRISTIRALSSDAKSTLRLGGLLM